MTRLNYWKHGKKKGLVSTTNCQPAVPMLKKKMFEKKILRKTLKKRDFLLFFNILTVTFDPKKVGSKK